MKNVRLLYASTVAEHFDPSQLDDILQEARAHNTKENITGVLFFTTTHFVQCIEGSRKAVNELYNAMVTDARHHSLTILLYEDISERMFSKWKMAYIAPHEISQEILESHAMGPGFNPASIDSTLAKAMLLLLVKHIES